MKNQKPIQTSRPVRNSELVYANKFYRDGKPRIIIYTRDEQIIFKDEPYGENKNRQLYKFTVKNKK